MKVAPDAERCVVYEMGATLTAVSRGCHSQPENLQDVFSLLLY
eukprot:COSAG02_NODE_33961_length_491_cov_1.301020_1_plen_42_part_01